MNFKTAWDKMENSSIVLRTYKEVLSDLEKLDKNLLVEIALDLDLDSLIELCKTSKRLNEFICNNYRIKYMILIFDINKNKTIKFLNKNENL